MELELQAQIDQAAAECRAAFAAHPEATWVWCCHHETEVEPIWGGAATIVLGKSADNRIEFILRAKEAAERVVRLRNFRPVLSELPEKLTQAGDAFTEAWRAYAQRIGGEKGGIIGDYHSAWRTYLDMAKSLHKELEPLHLADVPGHTWNGRSIFQ